MFSLLKKSWLLLLAGTGTFIVTASGETAPSESPLPDYLETRKLESSQYSQVDDLSPVDDAYTLSLGNEDQLIEETSTLALYFDEATTTFKIENKTTGYIFASHIDDPEAGTFNGLLESAVGIDFIRVDRNYDVRENVGLSDTIHTVDAAMIPGGIQLDIAMSGFCATRACERLYPMYLEGDYTEEEMLDVGFTAIDIAFTLEVTLSETGLHLNVPVASIEESSDTVRLASLTLFPGLGATEMDQIPGYMLLPDGAGALIRYEDNDGAYLSPYQAPFYGGDVGVPSSRFSVSNYALNVPAFGAVHGVYQDAFLGYIESGDLSARLLAYPNGALNQPYNLIFPKFDYRRIYRQSFTTDGSAGAPRELQTLFDDIALTYSFLDGDDAHYIGMAHTTRDHLDLSPVTQDDIPLHISYLMADSEASFFGASLVSMSTTDAVRGMHQRFLDAGIASTDVLLMGWNEGGHSGHLPVQFDVENSLGSRRDFDALMTYLTASGDVALANSYVMAGEASDASMRRDMVSAVDRFKLTFECGYCVYETTGILAAEKAQTMLQDDLDFLEGLGIDYFDESLGSTLSTMYQGGIISRQETADMYQAMVATGRLQVARPNAYLLDGLEKAYYMPTYHSSLEYFDDLVPFVPYVLNRSMALYSSYLNFNSIGRTGLLKLIDFGIYPAYLLTDEPASRLKNTDISGFYTTEFDRWESSIIDDYTFIKDALTPVRNADLVSRDIIALGVSRLIFDNGVTLYVNYQSDPVTVDGVSVDALDVLVVGGTP